MSRIPGPTFSHLLVGRALSVARFQTLLAGLHAIHASVGRQGPPAVRLSPSLANRITALEATAEREPDLYANYAGKVETRYLANKARYADLAADHAALAERLVTFLREYEAENRAISVNVIHGDPVFSNAILTGDNRVVFIDPRGSQGGALTLRGDALYDLAKVLQSCVLRTLSSRA